MNFEIPHPEETSSETAAGHGTATEAASHQTMSPETMGPETKSLETSLETKEETALFAEQDEVLEGCAATIEKEEDDVVMQDAKPQEKKEKKEKKKRKASSSSSSSSTKAKSKKHKTRLNQLREKLDNQDPKTFADYKRAFLYWKKHIRYFPDVFKKAKEETFEACADLREKIAQAYKEGCRQELVKEIADCVFYYEENHSLRVKDPAARKKCSKAISKPSEVALEEMEAIYNETFRGDLEDNFAYFTASREPNFPLLEKKVAKEDKPLQPYNKFVKDQFNLNKEGIAQAMLKYKGYKTYKIKKGEFVLDAQGNKTVVELTNLVLCGVAWRDKAQRDYYEQAEKPDQPPPVVDYSQFEHLFFK